MEAALRQDSCQNKIVLLCFIDGIMYSEGLTADSTCTSLCAGGTVPRQRGSLYSRSYLCTSGAIVAKELLVLARLYWLRTWWLCTGVFRYWRRRMSQGAACTGALMYWLRTWWLSEELYWRVLGTGGAVGAKGRPVLAGLCTGCALGG
jgi:hypothetical protein